MGDGLKLIAVGARLRPQTHGEGQAEATREVSGCFMARQRNEEEGLEEAGLYASSPSKEPKERVSLGLSCSSVALLLILALLYLLVWSLPAPTMWSKVSLLRQSWHLAEVMKEPPKLRQELGSKELELQGLRSQVEQVRARNDAVQAKVDVAEGARQDLKQQLSKIQSEVVRLQSQRVELTQKLEQEKKRHLELAEKWKKLKESELPLLNSIPDADT